MTWAEQGKWGWRERRACEEHFQQMVKLLECGTDWKKVEEETAVRDDSFAEATGLSREREGMRWHLLSTNICVRLDVCGPTYVSGKVALPWARLCCLKFPPMVSQTHTEARTGAWSTWDEARPGVLYPGRWKTQGRGKEQGADQTLATHGISETRALFFLPLKGDFFIILILTKHFLCAR